MWTAIAAIVSLIVGAVAGFFGGVYYLRRQMEKMQNDPEMLQRVAKQMGYNLNRQQMQRIQQMMSKQQKQKRK